MSKVARAVPASGIEKIEVNANDPKAQREGFALAEGLMDARGVHMSISVLLNATEQVLSAVLHATTPMPEANIDNVSRLLDSLKERVLAHSECALRINGIKKKEAVH